MISVVRALISAVCAVLCNFANLGKTGFVLNISERNPTLILKCCFPVAVWSSRRSVSSVSSRAQLVAQPLSPWLWCFAWPSFRVTPIMKVERGMRTLLKPCVARLEHRLLSVGNVIWMGLFCTRYFRIISSQVLGTSCAEYTGSMSLELRHMVLGGSLVYFLWLGSQLGGYGHVYFGVAL